VESYHRARDDATKLVRARPHLVPALAWNYISWAPPFCPRYFPPPRPFINEYHKDNPLPETGYDMQRDITIPV
jgi:hypothetical protein